MTAHDKALPTRNNKVNIMKEQGSKMCRMCGSRVETVPSECEKLAQRECKKRLEHVAVSLHCAIPMGLTDTRTERP